MSATGDCDGDGIVNALDDDDDGDGVLDVDEGQCPDAFVPPSISITGTPVGSQVTDVYTNFNGFHASSSSNISSILLDDTAELLAFTTNGITYSTGVADDNMLDNNNDGLFEIMDTSGNGSFLLPLVHKCLKRPILQWISKMKTSDWVQ